MNRFASIKDAVKDFKKGRMVIVVDDPSRENEGDLVLAAGKVTPEAINFMAKHGRGLICLPMEGERLDNLKITSMVENGSELRDAAFTVSVDARHGVTTGISAHDRAVTIKALLHPRSRPEDLTRPGHIFPLRYREGGVLVRAGHTEAAVDLAKLAGLSPAGVICEIMNENGTMARLPELMRFAKKHSLKIITIADLIKYRRQNEKLVRKLVTAKLPTIFGAFDLHLYEDILSKKQHLALVKGPVAGAKNVMVRVHSSCLTGEVLGSLRCDCRDQLQKAMQLVQAEGRGVVLYLNQEGRGIGLLNKLRSYELQDQGLDTVQANEALGFKPDLREYGIGAQILADLGLSSIRLLTNNPRKIVGIHGYGLKVTKRLPLEVAPTAYTKRYLKAKRDKLGHLLEAIT